jgi:hypothetical protein
MLYYVRFNAQPNDRERFCILCVSPLRAGGAVCLVCLSAVSHLLRLDNWLGFRFGLRHYLVYLISTDSVRFKFASNIIHHQYTGSMTTTSRRCVNLATVFDTTNDQ